MQVEDSSLRGANQRADFTIETRDGSRLIVVELKCQSQAETTVAFQTRVNADTAKLNNINGNIVNAAGNRYEQIEAFQLA